MPMQILDKYLTSNSLNRSAIIKGLQRLKGITGFISVIGDDPRTELFNRYHHVERVAFLTNYLGSLQKDVDAGRSVLLALLHDLNRLPFAHLLEKAIHYQQDKYFNLYFKIIDYIPDNKISFELQSIILKDTQYSGESSLVFLADCVIGFIEDSLFAFSLFGIDPDQSSKDIVDKLGFLYLPYFQECVLKIRNRFRQNYGFTRYFNSQVFKYAVNFINIHNLSDISSVDFDKFHELRLLIKRDLQISRIFPVNNEKISKGSVLFSNFFQPYMQYLNDNNIDPVKRLLQITDSEMLADAVKLGLLKCKKENLYPVY
jgi:hypothetical protein